MNYGWGWAGTLAAAVIVAVIGFWLAIRQDTRRWARDKRADLYIDLLAEAHAEHQNALYMLTRREVFDDAEREERGTGSAAMARWEADAILIADTRLPADARALLGARMAGFASPEVRKAFNALMNAGSVLLLRPGGAGVRRVEVGRAFDALERQIIAELARAQESLPQQLVRWIRPRSGN